MTQLTTLWTASFPEMIKMTHVVQKEGAKSAWKNLKEFATIEGAAKRIVRLRKRFKDNKYRVKVL